MDQRCRATRRPPCRPGVGCGRVVLQHGINGVLFGQECHSIPDRRCALFVRNRLAHHSWPNHLASQPSEASAGSASTVPLEQVANPTSSSAAVLGAASERCRTPEVQSPTPGLLCTTSSLCTPACSCLTSTCWLPACPESRRTLSQSRSAAEVVEDRGPVAAVQVVFVVAEENRCGTPGAASCHTDAGIAAAHLPTWTDNGDFAGDREQHSGNGGGPRLRLGPPGLRDR